MSWTKPVTKKGVLSLTQVDTYRFALALDGLVIYCGPEDECHRRASIHKCAAAGRIDARGLQDEAVIRAIGG